MPQCLLADIASIVGAIKGYHTDSSICQVNGFLQLMRVPDRRHSQNAAAGCEDLLAICTGAGVKYDDSVFRFDVFQPMDGLPCLIVVGIPA